MLLFDISLGSIHLLLIDLLFDRIITLSEKETSARHLVEQLRGELLVRLHLLSLNPTDFRASFSCDPWVLGVREGCIGLILDASISDPWVMGAGNDVALMLLRFLYDSLEMMVRKCM